MEIGHDVKLFMEYTCFLMEVSPGPPWSPLAPCPWDRLSASRDDLPRQDWPTHQGPLDGVPQCGISILRNGNVPCRCIKKFPVDFKIVRYRMSILRKGPCRVSNFISHVTRLHVALLILGVKGHKTGLPIK